MAEESEHPAALVGRWVKQSTTPGTEPYPERLEFTDRGTFVGSNDSTARYHPIWDVGHFQLLADGKVRLPTANDARIEYPMTLTGDDLTFLVGDQAAIHYRRET